MSSAPRLFESQDAMDTGNMAKDPDLVKSCEKDDNETKQAMEMDDVSNQTSSARASKERSLERATPPKSKCADSDKSNSLRSGKQPPGFQRTLSLESQGSSGRRKRERYDSSGSLLATDHAKGHRAKVKVYRDVFTQDQFDAANVHKARQSKTLGDRVKAECAKCTCTKLWIKTVLWKIFPFLGIMSHYSLRGDLVSDLIAGVTVGIMHIPQGMAYGLLSNLPPVYGLYVSVFPAIIYFFLGTSKHISIGTFAVASLMVGSVVDKANCSTSDDDFSTVQPVISTPSVFNATAATAPYTASLFDGNNTNFPDSGVGMSQEELLCKVEVAMAVTFMVGVFQFAMGLFQLGFVTIYLSEPLTRAFTTGAAVHVFTSQIKYVFGVTINRYTGPLKIIYTYIDFVRNISSTNVASLVMSVICMILLFVTKQWINPRVKPKIKMPIPMELILVVVGTLVSHYGQFSERFDMMVVGEIPTGVPAPRAPAVSSFGDIWVDAIGIAIVVFAINISLSNLFARTHNYQVDANQELRAYGVTNMVGPIFNCFVNAASLSRSLVQEGVGARTQVAALVSSALLLVVLFALSPLFTNLPNNVLAAIIIVNLKGMFIQLADLKKLWFISKYDFTIWLVTFLSVVILDVDLGLALGVGFSLLTVVFRTQSPYTCILGRVPKTDIYKDIMVYEEAQEVAGLKVFRFEGSLYYANSEHFTKKLFAKTKVNPRKLKMAQKKVQKKQKELELEKEKQQKKMEKLRKRGIPGGEKEAMDDDVEQNVQLDVPSSPLTHLVVDCTTMGYIDYVGVSTLEQVMQEYKDVDVKVCLAGCKAGVREMLEVAGFFKKIPRQSLFLSIHDAVLASLENNPILLEQLKADSKMALSMSSLWTLNGPAQSNPRVHHLRAQNSISESQDEPLLMNTSHETHDESL